MGVHCPALRPQSIRHQEGKNHRYCTHERKNEDNRLDLTGMSLSTLDINPPSTFSLNLQVTRSRGPLHFKNEDCELTPFTVTTRTVRPHSQFLHLTREFITNSLRKLIGRKRDSSQGPPTPTYWTRTLVNSGHSKHQTSADNGWTSAPSAPRNSLEDNLTWSTLQYLPMPSRKFGLYRKSTRQFDVVRCVPI